MQTIRNKVIIDADCGIYYTLALIFVINSAIDITRGQLLVVSWNMFYPESKECLILNEVHAEKVMDLFLNSLELK